MLGPWWHGWDEEFVWNRAGQKIINKRLLSCGYRDYESTRKPLLITNHHRLHLECAQRWQNLTMAHWRHVIFGDESRFHLYPVDCRLKVHHSPGEHFQRRCQAYRIQAGGGSLRVWGAFHRGAKSRLLYSPTDTPLVSSTRAFCETP